MPHCSHRTYTVDSASNAPSTGCTGSENFLPTFLAATFRIVKVAIRLKLCTSAHLFLVWNARSFEHRGARSVLGQVNGLNNLQNPALKSYSRVSCEAVEWWVNEFFLRVCQQAERKGLCSVSCMSVISVLLFPVNVSGSLRLDFCGNIP